MQYRKLDLIEAAGKGYLPSERPLNWALQYRSYPVVSFELVNFVHWYPICFEKNDGGLQMAMPAALMPGDSVLINPDTGKWIGRSMPFFLRRFPFQLAHGEGKNDTKGLKIADDPHATLSADARKTVVGNDGKLTPVAKNMIIRMARYDACLEADVKRMALILELDLLVPWQLDLGQDDHEESAYWKVDESRLLELSGEAVGKLHELKCWRMIYGHLYSLSLSKKPKMLRDRLQNRVNQESQQSISDIFDDDSGLIEF